MSSERDLYAGILAATEAKLIKPAILIEAEFPSGIKRIWSGYGQITFGGKPWQGVGEMLGIDAITEALDTAAQGISISFDAMDDSGVLALILGDNYQGSNITIYLTFYDEAAGEFIGAEIDWPEVFEDTDLAHELLSAELKNVIVEAGTFAENNQTIAHEMISAELQSTLVDGGSYPENDQTIEHELFSAELKNIIIDAGTFTENDQTIEHELLSAELKVVVVSAGTFTENQQTIGHEMLSATLAPA